MPRRTREEAARTRERILDAAVEVFHAGGLARPSLTEVAERAGVTRGAVYGHFKNKSDVFSALCDRIDLPLEAVPAAAVSADVADPLGRLRDGWVSFLHGAATDELQRKILSIIFHRCELLEENGAILQRLHQGRRQGMGSMAELIRQAVARGQLPAALDVRRALLLFHAAVAGLLSDWLFESAEFDLAAEAAPAIDAVIEMLRLAPSLRRRE
jgi:TetR/AcrR family acrAB operon transcriptional repressor